MGGRGSAGMNAAPNVIKNKVTSKFSGTTNSKKERTAKLPTVGPKVQAEYIDYVKKQIGIDLSKVRDTRFDDRNGFNIDTSQLTPSQHRALKNLTAKYQNKSEYDVQFMNNGAHREYIRVRRRKR